MRYRKILVALDRSPQTDIVFEQALELAKTQDAALMVFHCMPLDYRGSTGLYADMYARELMDLSGEIQAEWNKEKEEAREWLASYGQRATGQGVPTEWDLKVGDAAIAIRELTESWGADLVVLGRRGRRGLAEMVLGSVSNYVFHHVPCSVLIVQGISPNVDKNLELTAQAKS